MGHVHSASHSPSVAEQVELYRIVTKLCTPFDDCDKLERLWYTFYPTTPFQRISEGWKELAGFQHSDPISDIRGGGLLAVDQLLYFVTQFPTIAMPIAMEQLRRREKLGINAAFPFATAGVNVTYMLVDAMGVSGTRWTAGAGSLFWSVLREPDGMNELYCLAFEMLNDIFVQQGGTYLTFSTVLDCTRARLTAIMSNCVRTCIKTTPVRDIRAQAEVWGYVRSALVLAKQPNLQISDIFVGTRQSGNCYEPLVNNCVGVADSYSIALGIVRGIARGMINCTDRNAIGAACSSVQGCCFHDDRRYDNFDHRIKGGAQSFNSYLASYDIDVDVDVAGIETSTDAGALAWGEQLATQRTFVSFLESEGSSSHCKHSS